MVWWVLDLRNTCNKSVPPEIEFVALEWLARMQTITGVG